MRKTKTLIKVFLLLTLSVSPIVSNAKSRGPVINISGILKSIASIYGINLSQLEELQKQYEMFQKQYDIYKDQLEELKDTKKAFTGKYGFGKIDKSSVKAWLNDEQNIKKLLNAYDSGSGQFGRLAKAYEKEFPIDGTKFMGRGFSDIDKQYYSLSAKTALSTRTASEMEFNNIDTKISTQESLQQKIDSTDNVKASVDLLARMQAEGNKIMLENLRMLSILTQQAAIDSQGQINAVAKSARFLDMREKEQI